MLLEIDTRFHSAFLRLLSGLLGVALSKAQQQNLQRLKDFAERIAESPSEPSE